MLQRPIASLTTAITLGACAPAAQRVYVAPTFQTIVSETDVRQNDPPVHTIFIWNHSTVPVTVFSVGLTSCENVKLTCEPRRVQLRVGPQQRATALRVEPDNPYRPFTYRFSFHWRVDSVDARVAEALGARSDTAAAEQRELSREEFRAVAGRIASLRPNPESLVVSPGETVGLNSVRFIMLDSANQVLGVTRQIRFSAPHSPKLMFVPPIQMQARAPTRATVRFMLSTEAQAMVPRELPDVFVPIVVAYRFDANAPAIRGRLLDADSKQPLACVGIGLEDVAENEVNGGRTGALGDFELKAPKAGTYRLRTDMYGWWSVRSAPEQILLGDRRDVEYAIRFTEQQLVSRDRMVASEVEHARPAAVSSVPIGSNARPTRAETAIIEGITLGGSESMPILGVISRGARAGTVWLQFVVDSTGRADTTSLVLPSETAPQHRASLKRVLPRIRFSPARVHGKPTCEMLRMQVNFSSR